MENDKCNCSQCDKKIYCQYPLIRSILETTKDGFWILDREGKIIDVNPAYCLMSGYTKDELLQLSIPDLNPEKPNKTVSRIQRIIENGSERFEACHRRKDGSIFDVEVSATWSEEINCFVCFCHDITRHKEIKSELQESRDRHIAMTENIGDVIGIIRPDGIMEYLSPNIERLFGWKPEDLVGTDSWKMIYPEDVERIQKEFYLGIKKDNYSKTVEYRYRCKDGSYKWIELTAVNRINDPIIKGVLFNYRDITERRQTENRLLEKTKILNERVKELTCLHGISDLVKKPDITLEEVLYGTFGLIQASWQYQEIICSRILLNGEEYKTENFEETN